MFINTHMGKFYCIDFCPSFHFFGLRWRPLSSLRVSSEINTEIS